MDEPLKTMSAEKQGCQSDLMINTTCPVKPCLYIAHVGHQRAMKIWSHLQGGLINGARSNFMTCLN